MNDLLVAFGSVLFAFCLLVLIMAGLGWVTALAWNEVICKVADVPQLAWWQCALVLVVGRATVAYLRGSNLKVEVKK